MDKELMTPTRIEKAAVGNQSSLCVQHRAPPPVPSAFQPPPLLSNPSSVESALTRVSLAAEPIRSYTTPALRSSGSVLVHPNTLTGLADYTTILCWEQADNSRGKHKEVQKLSTVKRKQPDPKFNQQQ
ncbi:hypothetical protein PAXINDRAFT_15205 [Paxillus involutus ATCC 200175]|uniref:Uncharacterized protein n=1 Tax=Paxillus involutus ATCC 200175 TaxID=664439 RepID=A0A0C9STE1_PAXIN|nr:hypothetical protein PAXINDRAFT_15205 [Paxillus involutus ATCC 200175]